MKTMTDTEKRKARDKFRENLSVCTSFPNGTEDLVGTEKGGKAKTAEGRCAALSTVELSPATPLLQTPCRLEKQGSLNLLPLEKRVHGYNLLMLMFVADVIIAVTTMGGGNSWIQMERVGSTLNEYDFQRSVACFATIIAKVIAGYTISYFARNNMMEEERFGMNDRRSSGFKLLILITMIFQLLTAVLFIISPLLGPWVFYPANIFWGLDFSSVVIITYSNKVLDKENISQYSAQWFIASGIGSISGNLLNIVLAATPAIHIYGNLYLDHISAPALVGLVLVGVLTIYILRDFDDKGLHTWESAEEEAQDPLLHLSSEPGDPLPPKLLIVSITCFNILVFDLLAGASGTFFYPWLHNRLGWQSAKISAMTLCVSLSCIIVLTAFSKLSAIYNFKKLNVWLACQIVFLFAFVGIISQANQYEAVLSLLLMSLASTVGGSTLLSFYSGFIKLHPGNNVKFLSIWEVTRAIIAVFAPTLAPLFWCCRYTLMIGGTVALVIAMKLGLLIRYKTAKLGDDL